MIEQENGEGRIVSGFSKETEAPVEVSLRPRVLEEYIGQEKVKEKMRIFIQAAKSRGEALDHVLLYGPPGLERRRSRISSQTSSMSTCESLLARLLSARRIWLRF